MSFRQFILVPNWAVSGPLAPDPTPLMFIEATEASVLEASEALIVTGDRKVWEFALAEIATDASPRASAAIWDGDIFYSLDG